MPGEFLMSLQRFSQMVPLGNPDHVMLGVLKALHGEEKHTPTEWRALLQSLKSRPATSGVKRIG
jgi:hypothetical protein